MFNQVFLVGRLAEMPNGDSLNDMDHDVLIQLKVAKPYDGYDSHQTFIKVPVVIWQGMAKKLVSSARSGSYLAVKGRLLNGGKDACSGLYVCGESVRVLDFELSQLTKGE